MCNDARIAKFEVFIEEIWNSYNHYEPNCKDDGWIGLALIYDYRKLNAYGKVIMDFLKGEYLYDEEEELLEHYDDTALKIKVTKNFITEFYETYNDNPSFKHWEYGFIFWSLMILAVDDTDKEEHLSFICDLAKIWKVSDEEIMDIVQVVRIVYHMEEEEVKFQNESVKSYFAQLLRDYGKTSSPNASVMSGLLGAIGVMRGLKDEQ